MSGNDRVASIKQGLKTESFSLYASRLCEIMIELDEEASKQTFRDIMRIWINPEIERRTNDGRLSKDFVLDRAQVLLNPDKKSIQVRLNEEVKAEIIARFIGKHKEPNEPVFEHEIDEISEIRLTDSDDPNFAHVTMLTFRGRLVFHIDFRYNKFEAQKRYDTAKEFYDIAKICYDKKYWRPFADILFSSSELFVVSQLLIVSFIELKTTHRAIDTRYKSFMDIGNAKTEHKETFNKLKGLRDAGRYFNQEFEITPEEGEEMLKGVQEIRDFTKTFIR